MLKDQEQRSSLVEMKNLQFFNKGDEEVFFAEIDDLLGLCVDSLFNE